MQPGPNFDELNARVASYSEAAATLLGLRVARWYPTVDGYCVVFTTPIGRPQRPTPARFVLIDIDTLDDFDTFVARAADGAKDLTGLPEEKA